MEVRLIQKGERGLFIANGNKLLFPDKSWKDAREGFARDVEIVYDKGTYAFVRGKMLDTLPIDVSDVNIPLENSPHYRKGAVGGQEYLIEWCMNVKIDWGYRVFVRSDNPEGPSIETVRLVGKFSDVIEYLNNHADSIDMTDALGSYAQVLNFPDDESYAFTMFSLLQAVYEDNHVGSKIRVQLRVYNSGLVLLKHTYEWSSDAYEAYEYVGELGKGSWHKMPNFPHACAEKLWAKADDIDMKELSDMAMYYKVCMSITRFGNKSFDERLVSNTFECMGNGVVVYAFNMKGYNKDWFDSDEAQPYINLVEESFERLAFLKKQLAKRGLGADKLSALNARGWLMPFTLVGG